MTCMHCAEQEQLRLAARLETLERLNADLTKMLKSLFDKRISVHVSGTEIATLQPGAREHFIAQTAITAVRELERALEDRRALYRELTQLRFEQGPTWPK